MHGMSHVSQTAADDVGRPVQLPVTADANEAYLKKASQQLGESARQLRVIVERVTPEEFRWQESHYDHDSRHGRELLYLIANHEWVRATSEIVDITRSDAVDTTIKIDIDLDQITHEAFRKGAGRLWLPVIVLPPQATAAANQALGQNRPEPDPFATVTDAAGDLLAMLPHADVRHQISAAMAEIIVNMAVARWPGPDQERPTATRDQRLLLSAAIYRLLRRGSARTRVADRPDASMGASLGAAAGRPAAPAASAGGAPEVRPPQSRIGNARQQLLTLLDSYNRLLDEPSGRAPRADADSDITPDTDAARGTPQFAPELVRRAVMVLEALAESVVVVVPVNHDSAPTVLTVRVPTRSLKSSRAWKLARPSTWVLRPLGHLELDVLLPSADADRQVQVHLPDGVSFEEARFAEDQGTVRPSIVIEVERPQPLKDLAVLMGQLLDPRQRNWPPSLRQCVADLARAKAGAARETLRQHDVGSAADQASGSAGARQAVTAAARAKLDELSAALGQPLTYQGAALAHLEAIWDTFEQQTRDLLRRTSADRPSPRTVVARADMIEEVSQRAIPGSAKVHVEVGVTDAEYFSIARFSGGMSLLLMSVVLVFFAAAHLLKHSHAPSPEVLAIVLTLFSAIQAGRIERPDRSTLRGLLSAAGNWLIAASILPAVILAVALAFPRNGWGPVIWAGICIGLQLLFQLAMWRGPLTASGSPRRAQRRRFCTEPPDYHYSAALRSDWWRSTTADALMIGQKAYAYAVWQKAKSPSLTPLLMGARQDSSPATNDTPISAITPEPAAQSSAAGAGDGPANVLALLRSGTFGQATTFVVFREEPKTGWAHDAQVGELDLDPDRLAPMESVTGTVDVFVGVRRNERLTIAGHPLASILSAAAHRLIVLEAQLPVPVPVAGYDDMQWARVRVALRDDQDIRRLAPFLNDIHKRTTVAPGGHQRWAVAVQTVPASTPQITTSPMTQPAASPWKDRLVLASDLDVVNTAANGGESADARTWRALAICTDARSNIESDIVHGLAKVRPQLQLAGLTYALLHGTAVIVLLGHEPEARTAHDGDLQAELRSDLALVKLRVLVDEKLSRSQLGPVVQYPLLRVHFRSQDRPGALLNVLDWLSKTLADELPALRPADWSISYARTQVAAGRAGLTRLTVRIHTEPGKLDSWSAGTFEEIERKVRTLAGLEAAAAHHANSFGDELDMPEDPVISVSLIRTPAEARSANA